MRATVGATLAAALALTALAQAAAASTATSEGTPGEGVSTVRLTGGPERNVVSVTLMGATATISDQAGVEPGSGCSRPAGAGAATVECAVVPSRGGIALLRIELGEGDDEVVALEGSTFLGSLDGGPGNDVLRGGPSSDRLQGGAGDDHVFGLGGLDSLLSSSGPDGADELSGGDGVDRVSYEERTGPLSIDLDGQADDGEKLENDNVAGDVETIVGGRGADEVLGSKRAENLIGGSANDVLASGGGEDFMNGQDGDDRLELRDGAVGDAACGRGEDHLLVDRRDMVRRACENVDRPMPAAAVPLGSGPDSFATGTNPTDELGGGGIGVTLGCPLDVGHRCRGRASLLAGGRPVGRIDFNLRRGTTVARFVGLRPTFRKRVRRRGSVSAELAVRSRDPRGRIRVLRQAFTVTRE